MSSDRFGLVLAIIEGAIDLHLYETPMYSGLKVGDKVYVEGVYHTCEVKAVWDSCYADSSDKEAFEMLVKACGAKLPLPKVQSKISLSLFNYEED